MERTIEPEEKVELVIPPGMTIDELIDAWCTQTTQALPTYLTQLTEKKRLFILCLIRKFGNITYACQAVDMSRVTYYAWLEKDKIFKQACWEVEQGLIDETETMLHHNIQNGKESSIHFFLERKAKDRGYGKELVIGGSMDHKYSIDLNKLNIEEIEYFKRIMSKAGIQQLVDGSTVPALTG